MNSPDLLAIQGSETTPSTSDQDEQPRHSGEGHQPSLGSATVTHPGAKRKAVVARDRVDGGATSPKQSHLSSSQQDQLSTQWSNAGTSCATSSASMAWPFNAQTQSELDTVEEMWQDAFDYMHA
eukprot:TRINITY_DN4637_c0_g1_i1.p2 TRINITY_DN4637_c0_g1~~TRINITY_DN4637_c0_g1_i1.p2  ORF type:complete len:124 (+),score=12.38 TRINITY_DN4637_c0_g1_i1:755-1126(+)